MRPYLRVANVFEDRIDLRDVMEMNFSPSEAEQYELKPGDVLLNEGQSRELVGRPAMYRGELPGACFTNSLVRFSSGPGILPEFALQAFRHYLKSGRFQEIAQITTNIAHLGAGRFAALEIPLAPLSEQRRIVAKLEELLARSKRAKQALQAIPPLLDRLRQSILASAFRGDLTADWRAQHPDVEPAEELLKRIRVERRKQWEDRELGRLRAKGKPPSDDGWKDKYKAPEPVDATELPTLPSGWCWSTIDTVGDVLLGRRRAGLEYVAGVDGRELRPYLRVANVKEDAIDLSDVLTMPFNATELDLYALRPGDIILSEGQSPELVGQSGIYRGGMRDLCIQATVHRFRSNEVATTPEYAQLVFLHHLKTGVFRRAASLTTNIAHLTSERLRPLPFPLAPLAEQAVLVKRVRASLDRARSAAIQLSRGEAELSRLEAAFLAKAFRGELTEQDPNDEPAEVMLARLKAVTHGLELATGSPRARRRA